MSTLRPYLGLGLLLVTSLGSAQVALELRNAGGDLFQPVAEIDLTGRAPLLPPPTKAVPVVTAADGSRTPAQYLPEAQGGPRLLIGVPGLLAAGESGRYDLRWEEKAPSALADLTVDANAERVRVDNVYHGLTFPAKGHGGFPDEIRFNVSGDVEQGFTFEDRLFGKDRGFAWPRDDTTSTAHVVVSGPLRVVVEQRFRYVDGKGANPGGAKAVYRWTLEAGSPAVRVEAAMSRESDLEFTWPELHFLQISRADARFSQWAGGDPVLAGSLGPTSHSQAFARWGVLHDGLDALGMAIEGGIGFWDGTTEYVTYLQRCEPWSGPERKHAADLYLGPSRTPERMRDAMLAKPQIIATVLPAAAAQAKPPGETVAELRNQKLGLAFARVGEAVGLAQIESVEGRHAFVRAGATPGMWRLQFHKLGLPDISLLSAVVGAPKVSAGAEEARFTWTGLDLGEERGVVDVEVSVRLPAGSETSLWRIRVDNRSTRYGLWQVHFPLVNGLSAAGECDVAVPRSNWGILYPKLAGTQSGSYPSANWPFQMLTLNEGDAGLVLACQDPQAWPKSFALTPGGEFYFSVWAANAGVPGSDFETPGDVAVGVYQGDWMAGCKLYRQWALAHAPWTQKGRLSQRADTPKAFRELPLWMIGNGRREEIVPTMLKAADFFQMPLGLHWYSWHEIPFDTHYPEYFPYKPGFPEGVKELTSRGLYAMPYINGRLHDMDIPSFAEAKPWCTKDEKGEPYMEVYPSQARQAIMCPYTKYWQTRLNGVIERLVNECGVNAVYIDQIGAAGPQICFDPTHGHPVGGGSHWVDGYRELLKRTKEIGHSGGHEVAFTTENNAEPYMDGVDAFLIWNPRDQHEIPMMTAVYSGYTTYFSSPVGFGGGAHSFWMAQARDFLWGCQLGWMDPGSFLQPGNRRFAEDLKRLGQYRAACRKFLTYGELLGSLGAVGPVETVTGKWNNWSGALGDVALPAVETAVWRAEDGTLGVFFANLADEPKRFTYEFSPARFGDLAAKGDWLKLTRVSPEGSEVGGYLPRAGGQRTEYLAADEVLVYEVTPTDQLPAVAKAAAEAQPAPGLAGWKPAPGDRASLDAWCLAHKASWELRFPPRAARGEPLAGTLVVNNDGNAPFDAAWQAPGQSELQFVVAPQHKVTAELPMDAPQGDRLDLATRIRFADDRSGCALTVPVGVELCEPVTVTVQPVGGDLRAGESAPLLVRVANNRRAACDVLVGLRTPPGWDLTPGATLRVPAVQPGEERQVPVLADVPANQGAAAAVEAFVIADRTSTPLKVLPPRPQARAHRLPAPPQIDAQLAEWRDVPALTLGPANAANLKDYGGETDLSGDVRLAWDETNLYLAATVTDQTFAQTYLHKDMWQGDCIQLAFRPGTPPRHSTYDSVRELGLALTSAGPELWMWSPVEGTVTDGKIAVVREGTRTIYEAALPWTLLGGKPAVGQALAFALTLNDNDGNGFRGWLEWASGLCGAKDASHFGALVLE